ncbi:fumarylacetoacetate hydrolase family protein [Corynebacterium sp. TAE3-ERU12]|uniref:fumarylacetoacetate hydrolase family protein n=1 Tax=Corynebacterium sp. TAE3-ERU12 TaxID=2849491 RepID=UPI001C46191A|nr:fumarylacetoacetate hydrolase family protein [Corynebacterium sp. TAE3-ERU12]MBV7295167.1 fumarylacetoacetate hydrolase family protein [Corynebacterium sp. TAE3-ERU12]
MRIARIAHPEGMCFALVEGDDSDVQLHEIEGHPFADISKTGRSWPLSEVRLLSPMLPSKVVAIGRNYADHVKEVFKASGESLPPTLFLKPPTAVTGPEAPIRIPDFATKVEFEGELALVIGRPCKNVSQKDAEKVIFGYTIVNDVSSRDLQFADGQWARAKGIDSFCPLGPWIQTELDYRDLPIKAHLTHDGETHTKQNSNSEQMIMSIPEIIEFITASMTLLPGDVICTGSPAGTAEMVPGDRIEIEIPGIGKLANPVERAD